MFDQKQAPILCELSKEKESNINIKEQIYKIIENALFKKFDNAKKALLNPVFPPEPAIRLRITTSKLLFKGTDGGFIYQFGSTLNGLFISFAHKFYFPEKNEFVGKVVIVPISCIEKTKNGYIVRNYEELLIDPKTKGYSIISVIENFDKLLFEVLKNFQNEKNEIRGSLQLSYYRACKLLESFGYTIPKLNENKMPFLKKPEDFTFDIETETFKDEAD